MAGTILEYMPLVRHWPKFDTAITVFRYALVREMCRGKRVLEIGAALLADVAAEVVALDHQDLWSGSPAAPLPNVRFVQGDALDLRPDWRGRFDVVIAMELIEHLADPAAFQRVVFHVLADDGVLVLSTPNFDLYSMACDGARTPIYRHHLREYRAAELDDAVLDIWGARRIVGISQLSLPGDAIGGNGFALLYDAALYDLVLGEKYPAYDLRRIGTLDAPLPLCAVQSFLVMLGKGPRCRQFELSTPVGSDPLPTLSTVEAAFRSCQMILRRKNQHIKDINHPDHTGNLEAAIANRDQHIGNLERLVSDLRGIVADREARLAAMLHDLQGTEDQANQQKNRLSSRIGGWIGAALRAGRKASAPDGPRRR
jgi:SAM-dependent methyltransferase